MNLHAHAASMMHLMGPGRNPAVHTAPGLPRVPGSRNPQLGATRTHLDPAHRPALIDVAGQPSMKVVPQANGGVQTVLKRLARSADYMTADDFRPLLAELKAVEKDAVRMSQGGASLRELRRRGHPYGRGPRRGRITSSGRAGIPNKAIVNRQSGRFMRLWSTRIERSKNGADFILENSATTAKYLLGTARMQAHGPFVVAMLRRIHRINTLWLKAARDAQLREIAMEGMNA